MGIPNTAFGRIKTSEVPYPQYSGMRYPPKTAEEIEQFEAGKRDGFLGELKEQALSAGSLVLDSLVQLGDVLTLGMNHKTSAIQEVWQRQAGRGDSIVNAAKGIGNAVAHPIDTLGNIAQSVTDGFQKYENLTKAGNFYEAGKMQGEVVAGMVDPGKGAGKAGKIGILGDKAEDVTSPKKNGEVVIKQRRAPFVEVKCFGGDKTKDKTKQKEYDDQLEMQEKAINDMSVEEYEKNRKTWENLGRTGAAQQAADRADAIAKMVRDKTADFMSRGVDPTIAKQQGAAYAQNAAKGMDILHSPDLSAGGSGATTGLGDKGVNRSIGSNWAQDKGLKRTQMDDSAKAVPDKDKAHTKMNVKLKRCNA